ncbi:hypothetical protein ACFL5V_04825 [Fibrobacterota bacterium]
MRLRLYLGILLVGVSCPFRVQAQYYNSVQHFIGERAASMGGAFTAIGDNSSALWYNPAGLAHIKSPSLNVSANSYSYLSTAVKGDLEFQTGIGEYQAIDQKESDFSIVGSSLIYGKQLSKNTGFAFGVFAPFQDNLNTLMDGDVIAPEFMSIDTGGDTTIYHYETEIKKSMNMTSKHYIGMAGLGYSLSDRLHAGISLGLGQYSRTQKGGTFMYLTLAERSGSGTSLSVIKYIDNSLSAYTIHGAFGLQWFLSKRHKLGMQYKSATFILGGTQINDICEEDQTIKSTSSLDVLSKLFASSISAGYGYDLPESFAFSFDVIPAIPSNSSDAPNFKINLRLGLEKFFLKKYIFRSGLFTDFSQKQDVSLDSENDSKIDYFGSSVSFSFPKEFAISENQEIVKKRLWSTFGINYRYGFGDIKTNRFDYLMRLQSEVKNQTVNHISVFIAESIAF